MIQSSTGEPKVTFADTLLHHTEKRWEKHWLKKVRDKVNWKKFFWRFEKLYAKDNGRPAWDPVLLFRCLLLAEWYGLSDRQLEEAVEFRIDFRKFVGLSFEEEAPDATTFVVFRERITKIYDKLLRILNAQLKAAGLKIDSVVSVDATLIEAHSKPHGDYEGDADATWRGFPAKEVEGKSGEKTFARRPALFGYKVNLSASVATGFVSRISVCPANEHESKHFTELLSKETHRVYADKGYVGCREYLKGQHIQDGIQEKGYRNHPLTRTQIARNKRITKWRRIVEGNFGGFKQWYDWWQTKYMGLLKNQLAVTMTALAWNMKKWAALST